MRGALNILVLLVSTLVSLCAAELGAAMAGVPLAPPRSCPDEFEPRASDRFDADPDVGWRMKPSHRFAFSTEGRRIVYQSDEEGLRTYAPPAPQRPSVTRRVVVAGDSYAWGYGVAYRDSFSGLIERLSPGTAVRNVAMPGFGLDQIWLSARHLGQLGSADLLVVTIYPDDLERSLTAFRQAEGLAKPSFRWSGNALVRRAPEDCPPALERFLEAHSRLHALARRVALRLGRTWGWGEWWELNAAILDALRADAADASVPVLFVHVPYESWQPFPALARYMAETQTPFLDLYTEFGVDHERFYFAKDGHLNDDGHRRLAELIGAFPGGTPADPGGRGPQAGSR